MVSIIMPIRNEADYIGRAIQSILDNDYPNDKLEIIVADGCSTDGTQNVVQKISKQDIRVCLINNPGKIVPTAMNIGIKASKGEILIRVDGHAEIFPDFIKNSVICLENHPEVWCAGGVMETIGSTYIGNVIAAAMSCPVGVGGGNFRLGTKEGYVDSVPFGAHRRWVFDKVGMFDEELVRNQDDEFILRMVEAGGKQYMSPNIRSRYFSRSSFRKLARQYFQYGFWRIRTIQKRGKPASFRQMIPLFFVLGWFFLFLTSPFWVSMRYVLVSYALIYLFVILLGVFDVGRKKGWKIAALVPVAFIIMHTSYGLGTLKGIWSWIILKGKKVSRPESHGMSR